MVFNLGKKKSIYYAQCTAPAGLVYPQLLLYPSSCLTCNMCTPPPPTHQQISVTVIYQKTTIIKSHQMNSQHKSSHCCARPSTSSRTIIPLEWELSVHSISTVFIKGKLCLLQYISHGARPSHRFPVLFNLYRWVPHGGGGGGVHLL